MIEPEKSASDLPRIRKRWRSKASWEEKQSYYAQWRQSQLNKTQFCEQQGISKSAFYRWINEVDRTPLAHSTPKLIPVELTCAEPAIVLPHDSVASSPSGGSALDIWLPNGIHLRASLGNALTTLTLFIREISDVNPTNTIS